MTATLTPPRLDVKFVGDDGRHDYYLNGSKRPSVTTVMKAEGLTDYQWCDEDDRTRGDRVHKIAQLISRNWRGSSVAEVVANSRWDPAQTDPRLLGYGYATASFLLKTGFRPIMVEQPVGSTDLNLCGTLDAVGLLPDGTMLLPDYKSGAPLPGVWIQMALYAYMLERTYGLKVDAIAPVHVKKDGEFKMWPTQPPGGVNLAMGISAVNLYHWRAQHKMLPKGE
jgi:hypothetical protein